MRVTETLLVAVLLLAAPAVLAQDHGPADESAWGRCQAQDNNQQGNESSNGTVQTTTAFANLSEEDCNNATAPWENANDSSQVPNHAGPGDHPGADDNPGDDRRDDRGSDDRASDEGGADDGDHPDDEEHPDQDNHPDEGDNRGDDRGR